jgi:deoxycytidylate deaminase/dephospho-CoA kinase
MGEAVAKIDLGQSKGEDVMRRGVDEFKSHDLVFALVAHAGSGATVVATQLQELLGLKGYDAQIVKLSGIIKDVAFRRSIIKNMEFEKRSVATTVALQDAGDELRRLFGASAIASLAIQKIHTLRSTEATKPVAFILDSIKHYKEVEMLRAVYGNSFYLISVICSPDNRIKRLKDKYEDDAARDIEDLADRDDVGGSDFGQNVRKTLFLGDLFISNENPEKKQLASDLDRFVDIINDLYIAGPTRHEKGMFAAYCAALTSSCLSRQIGAAILDDDGNIISSGRNDVPMSGGGLYSVDCSKDDRCHVYRQCENDALKERMYKDIFNKLKSKGILSEKVLQENVRSCLQETRIKDLIEFSRAVHAEMDAIVGVARTGRGSTSKATLYTTTYPCHNCARHIVAAGIKEVIYIEPYPKSLAAVLHDDAIIEMSPAQSAKGDRVPFRLFSGVAPRRYASLFERLGEVKDPTGKRIELDPKIGKHRNPILLVSYLDIEKKIADQMMHLIEEDN